MHFGKLGRGEIIASLSGVVLGLSLFMNWYGTDKTNANSKIDGKAFVDVSAWDVEDVVRYLLLAAAAAPLILAYVIIRDHQLSWPRGELTAVVAITALVLVLVIGFVLIPGDPKDTISLEVGWFIALAATIGMVLGATQRTSETARPRKPPGTV